MLTARHRCYAGFTLVEICIVMAIMAVLMAIGMPSYRTWIENSKLRATAESISEGLVLARSEAVTRNTSVDFKLDVGTGAGWTVGCTTPVATTCPAVIHSRQASEGSSSKVTATVADGRTFTFSSVGRLTAPVPSGAATTIDINVDMAHDTLSAADSRDLRIVVSIGGSVRMCDPNVTAPDTRAC